MNNRLRPFHLGTVPSLDVWYQRRGCTSTDDPELICSYHNVIPPFEMNSEDKDILRSHFNNTFMAQRPNAFHKTMLNCIQSSPKLNEIIACQIYCYRDLTKWPKLNGICQAQQSFYSRLIYQLDLDSSGVADAAYSLGRIHFHYAQYGMKPHFLDLWTLHMEKIVSELKFDLEKEKKQFLNAFRQLSGYITEMMNLAYSRCQQEALLKSRAEAS